MKKKVVWLAVGMCVFFSGSVMAAQVEVSGSLGITGIAGTDGVVFPDGTSQTSAVIGSQYQKRITASCSSGYAMRAIDATGGVATCEPTGLTGTLGTNKGGTGITSSPSAAGQYLRSTGAGLWGISGIQAADLPVLSGNYVDLTTTQSIGGTKTFLNPIVGTLTGSINGNAATVTNGVYTTGSYTNPSWLTSFSAGKLTGTLPNSALAGTYGNQVSFTNVGNSFTGTGVSASTFSLPQTTGAAAGVLNLGLRPFMHACCGDKGNTFVGPWAGNFTTTGPSNTAIGNMALNSLTIGMLNTATGNGALGNLTTGSNNTAIGGNTLFSTTSGSDNTAIGIQALNWNTTASGNTAIGSGTLSVNCYSVAGECPARFNTAVGVGAGSGSTSPLKGNITGSNNTYVGAMAGNESPTNLTNATAIGAYSQVVRSNALVLGGTGQYAANVGIGTTDPQRKLHIRGSGPRILIETDDGFSPEVNFKSSVGSDWAIYKLATNGDLRFYQGGDKVIIQNATGYVGIGTASPDMMLTVNGSADKPGGGSWGTFSDARLKTVGDEFRAGLSEVLGLTPRYYRYNEQNPLDIADCEEHVGFVAQEVEKVIPEAISRNAQGYLLVNNDPILWAMLNAIKQQQALISEKDARIEKLERDIERIARALESLTIQVAAIEGTPKTVALK